MCTKIKVEKVSGKINKWCYESNGKEFTWNFSKEMPIEECKVNIKEFSSILNSQLKNMEKLVAMFMYTNRFATSSACLYTNIRAAERLGVTGKTMGKALSGLVKAGVLGRVRKDCGDFIGYQYYIKEMDSWKLPAKKGKVLVVELD